MLQARFSVQFLLLLGMTCSCAVLKGDKNRRYRYSYVSAAEQIGGNLYYDEQEITNLSWLFYLSWTEQVFGRDSDTFKAALPDSSVWLQHDSCMHNMQRYYHRHPSYQGYPVVAISQKQAQNYSKWRTDRVFEQFLIKNGVLRTGRWHGDSEDHFTVERYFSGEYRGMEPDTNIKYYCRYSLPSLEQRELALVYNDSILRNAKKKRLSKYEMDFLREFPDSQVIEMPTCNPKYSYNRVPIESCFHGVFVRKELRHLKGNVSEWLAEPNTSAGGSWYHSRAQLEESDLFTDSLPNAWTGFRNVAQWVPVPKSQ